MRTRLLKTFLLMIIFSCNNSKDYYNWSKRIINKYGNYHLLNRPYVIKVDNNKGLLDYSLLDSMNNPLIKPNEHIGVYNKWSLYWDDSKSWLWVFSSDIGVFVWLQDENKKYKQVTLKSSDTDLIAQIPKEFYSIFPTAFKKIYLR